MSRLSPPSRPQLFYDNLDRELSIGPHSATFYLPPPRFVRAPLPYVYGSTLFYGETVSFLKSHHSCTPLTSIFYRPFSKIFRPIGVSPQTRPKTVVTLFLTPLLHTRQNTLRLLCPTSPKNPS